MGSSEKITGELLAHVAGLARLDLTADERASYAGQLGRILQYIEKLDSLDLADVEPTAHVFSAVNVFRDDQPADSLPRDAMLGNASEQTGEFYRVPRIID